LSSRIGQLQGDVRNPRVDEIKSTEGKPDKSKSDPGTQNVDPVGLLKPMPDPEVVFGLVGPIGVELTPVVVAIEQELAGKYRTKAIRLSELIEEFFGVDYSKEAEHLRIRKLMHLGTYLRKNSGLGEAVGLLGIEEIKRVREEELENTNRRNAFVIRSMKTPEEVQLFRNVYGRGFYLISVYSQRENRVSYLSDRLANSLHGDTEKCRARAERLVELDELENTKFGQDVQDAFPLAGLFINADDRENLRVQIRRFIELVFGFRFATPTRDEHGMQHARSAALRSSDMNRQVGAAITNAEGDLLVVGCNDVPKAGGGFYWPDSSPDERDFKKGVDSMSEHRGQVIRELLARLESADLLKVDGDKSISQVADELLKGDLKWVLKGATATSILEFGRSVHAEMAAISTAARLGIALQGSTLYVTTFPCHICARHIVASGIRNVFYIEPYPKSRAKRLHSDAILVDPGTTSDKMVNFQPFKGVAPLRFFELFDSGDARKDADGRVPPWKIATGTPRFQRFIVTYIHLETTIVGTILPAIREKRISLPNEEIETLAKEFA
jgi:deoxycytidylate deaminase